MESKTITGKLFHDKLHQTHIKTHKQRPTQTFLHSLSSISLNSFPKQTTLTQILPSPIPPSEKRAISPSICMCEGLYWCVSNDNVPVFLSANQPGRNYTDTYGAVNHPAPPHRNSPTQHRARETERQRQRERERERMSISNSQLYTAPNYHTLCQ